LRIKVGESFSPNCGKCWEGSEEDTNQGFGDRYAQWCPDCYRDAKRARGYSEREIEHSQRMLERLFGFREDQS
jgi:hypothetical protein